ncbi:MAG: hypothetical protein ACKVT0_22325, partial [Planctomycetaceae bacterium]
MILAFLDPNLIGLTVMATAIAMAMTLFAAPRILAQLNTPNRQQRSEMGRETPHWKRSVVHNLSLWMGILSGIVAVCSWGWTANAFWRDWLLLQEVLTAGITVSCLGLIHDAFSLRRRELAAGQILVCMILVSSGIVIRKVAFDEGSLELGIFAVPVTLAWLFAAINLFAFVDKNLGLSAISGIIVGVVLIGTTIGHAYFEAILLCSLIVGGLIGWAIYGMTQGETWLGRTATMQCGILLGIVSTHLISVGRNDPGLVRLSPGLAVWAFPLIVAMLHAAYRGTFSAKAFPIPTTAPGQAVSPSRSLAMPRVHPRHRPHAHSNTTGSRNWEPLWETLRACADQLELSTIELQIDLPSQGEAFHKAQVRQTHPRPSELWQLEFPLRAGEKQVGRVHLVGGAPHESISSGLSQVMMGLRPFEIHFLALLEAHPHL